MAREEPSEGAALSASRPLCECHGETCVKNGKGGWRCAIKARETNRICAARNPGPRRERARRWSQENPQQDRAIKREHRRRQLGWYDEDGMATKPLQVKELG